MCWFRTTIQIILGFMKEKGQQNTALANVSWKFLKNGSPVPRPPPSSKTPTSTKTKRDSSSGVEEKPAHVSGGRNARVSRRGSGLKIVSLNDALEKEKVEREEEQDLMNSVLELLTSPVSVSTKNETQLFTPFYYSQDKIIIENGYCLFCSFWNRKQGREMKTREYDEKEYVVCCFFYMVAKMKKE